MIKFKIKVDDKDIFKEMMARSAILEVGFLNGEKYPDGTSVATVAARNEFGGGRVPPRPFMRTAIKRNKRKWRKFVQDWFPVYGSIGQTFEELGDKMVEDVKDSIWGWTTPPNAPSTIAKKGFNKPLIETKRMVNSVSKKVRVAK